MSEREDDTLRLGCRIDIRARVPRRAAHTPLPRGRDEASVSPTRVRSLLERFALTVDLDSTTYADVQRDFGGLLGSRLTEVELWALIDWLALRLPTPSARERFLVDVADLRV